MDPTDPSDPLQPEDTGAERTVASDLLVGRKLGEYVVKQRIGSGGMGVVYEGEQPLIGRRVAIKILRGDADPSRGLLDEARAANSVRHRGIVDIFGFGEVPGLGEYLVMEFLDGKPLDAVLHEEGAMRPTEVVHILDELLAPLEAAHARGVVHRDLKPSNVFLIDEPGGGRYVKLLDFGLAKRMSVAGNSAHQTRVTAIVGTPYYMAPEQARSQTVGPKTDLYSVGVMAFEMLTGHVPFTGTHALDVVSKHVNEPPPLPSGFAAVPPALEALVLQLLSKAPEQRPAAQAVRQQLKRIRRDLADAATQMGPVPAPPRPKLVPAAPVSPDEQSASTPGPIDHSDFAAADRTQPKVVVEALAAEAQQRVAHEPTQPRARSSGSRPAQSVTPPKVEVSSTADTDLSKTPLERPVLTRFAHTQRIERGNDDKTDALPPVRRPRTIRVVAAVALSLIALAAVIGFMARGAESGGETAIDAGAVAPGQVTPVIDRGDLERGPPSESSPPAVDASPPDAGQSPVATPAAAEAQVAALEVGTTDAAGLELAPTEAIVAPAEPMTRKRHNKRSRPRNVAAPPKWGEGTLKVGVIGGRTAQVILDGRAVGQTPWEAPVSAGEHRIRLVVDGAPPAQQTVRVRAGATVKVLRRWNATSERLE